MGGYVDKGVVRLCGAWSSSHPTTLVPEVFLNFFFVKKRANREAATTKRKFLSYGILKQEGLQTVRNLRNDGDDRTTTTTAAQKPSVHHVHNGSRTCYPASRGFSFGCLLAFMHEVVRVTTRMTSHANDVVNAKSHVTRNVCLQHVQGTEMLFPAFYQEKCRSQIHSILWKFLCLNNDQTSRASLTSASYSDDIPNLSWVQISLWSHTQRHGMVTSPPRILEDW